MKKILIKGNKLFLEDGQSIFLTKEIFSRFSLRDKEFLNDEEFNSLIYFRIRLSALIMLQKRDYFQKELSDKLRKKYNFPNIIEKVCNEFKEKKYLNDEEQAYSYAKLHPNYGKKKLAYIFYKMGINKEKIQEILFENKNQEIENIKTLWQKLGNRNYNKKIESLMRKGFSYGDIKKVISSSEEEEKE